MSSELNRRFFIRQLLATAGGLAAASSMLSSCSTLDEYFFEDHYYLKDQVLIIGGGLSGLYLAYKLKQNKTEFRLLEGSNRFGGRIRSSSPFDFGASVFSPTNDLLKTLLKELFLTSEVVDRKNLFLPEGMQTLTDKLAERISGLMPYRSLRLQWQLVSIQKINNLFELIFETPRGRRTLVAKRVALAIPPTQWSRIAGLYELDEMTELREWIHTLKVENIMKVAVNLPSSAKPGQSGKINTYEDEAFSVRQVTKHFKSQNWTEIDFISNTFIQSFEIEQLNDFMKRKMQISLNYNKLTTENYFDWQNVGLIKAAYFKNAMPWPEVKSLNFQVIGDFATLKWPHSMEGALNSALRASEIML
jgi:predicted NAD/FAD-dependent oxidoreductase